MSDPAVNLQVSPFTMLDILKLEIHVEPNQHATASVKGTIDEEAESSYLTAAGVDLPVTISQVDDSCVLFTGIISSMKISSENGLKVLDLELVSGTRQMDMVEHTRTYQDASMQYRTVLSSLGYYPEYSFSMRIGDGSSIGDLITQFKETDWTFIKRLASHFNSCIIPDYLSSGVGYYFGIPDKSSGVQMNPSYYWAVKGVGDYENKTDNQVSGLIEGDELCYIVRDRTIFRMGEKVQFQNREMNVYAIHSVLDGQLLQNYYTLKSEAGFKTKMVYNFRLVGASLACNVTQVKQDMVQVHITEDDDEYDTGAKWFAYSTVYSSPDGTGWYAMPEEGDELRLYFPTEREAEAYTINAVNVDSPGIGGGTGQSAGSGAATGAGTSAAAPEQGILPMSPPRTNPDVKTMINKFMKEVSLYPDKIVITNNKDMMIVVDDAQGIMIQSAKEVHIKSDAAISLASTQTDVNVLGAEQVSMTVGGTKVELTKDVKFTGGSLYLQ